jgi:MFS family permease
MAAGGLGGVIFPLILEPLFKSIGFAWATRVFGFILLALLLVANLLIKSRLPHRKLTKVIPDLRIFGDKSLTLITVAVFLIEFALFIPLAYISSYGVAYGDNPNFGANALAVMNAGSVVGRLLAGWVSDRFGRFNTLMCTILLCAATTFGLWLPAKSSKPMLWAFSVLFGVTSGSNLSLSPVCVGQLCKTEHYGRYYATCYMVVSFA